MVNSEAFIGRLEKILGYYTLTASAFADKIGVQRSSISHLLSGRNKPSLEFVLKVVHTFPEINLYWLLNGKGSFPSPGPGQEESAAKPEQKGMPIGEKAVDKVIIFYTDGTFQTYTPS